MQENISREMQEDIERVVASLNAIDDVFFQKLMESKAVAQELLQVILQKKNLKVVQCAVQLSLRNIGSHSVVLDAVCRDEADNWYNVEVQKADSDDYQKRARFNMANMDTKFTEKGVPYDKLPEIYVIFITNFDIFKRGKTVYNIGRIIKETGDAVYNGTHELYINTAVDDGSEIAELMQYMKKTEGENRRFPQLSQRVQYFKNIKESDFTMMNPELQKFLDKYSAKIAAHSEERGKVLGSISTLRSLGMQDSQIVVKIMELFKLTKEDALEYMAM